MTIVDTTMPHEGQAIGKINPHLVLVYFWFDSVIINVTHNTPWENVVTLSSTLEQSQFAKKSHKISASVSYTKEEGQLGDCDEWNAYIDIYWLRFSSF